MQTLYSSAMADDVTNPTALGTAADSTVPGIGDRAAAALDSWSPYVALVVAWVALLGSMYFSQVRGWLPCDLCWYQRILMYPLALVIPIGILRRDGGLPVYVFPFTLLGSLVATYHVLDQKTDWFSDIDTCQSGIPCSLDYLNWLGWVTIPMLALTAFVLIAFSMSAARHEAATTWAATGPRPWAKVLGAIACAWAFMAIAHFTVG